MKTIITIIGNTILTIVLLIAMIGTVAMLDMTSGFTAPAEAKFTGIEITTAGVATKYQIYRDPTKTVGYQVLNTYYAPILEEVGLI